METAKSNSIGDGKTGCLVCGESDTRITRGLCVMHHNRWRKQRDTLPESARKAFDKELIERGLLLPSRQGRPAIDDDVFADVASEVLKHMAAKEAQGQLLPGDMAARLASEMASDAEAEQEENLRPGKPTGAPAPKKSPKRGKSGGKRSKS